MSNTNKAPSDVDVLLNKYNLALARSQRILNSWLPPAAATTEQEDPESKSEDDEFQSMSETAGLGSKAANQEYDETTHALLSRRATSASRDKLLEQILGKKGAEAKKKAQAQKQTSLSTHQATKPLNVPVTRPVVSKNDEDDDQEEGRASVFLSRGEKLTKRSKTKTNKAHSTGMKEDAEAAREDLASTNVVADTAAGGEQEEESTPVPAKKRKVVNSYLDDLLAAKKKKKNKARG